MSKDKREASEVLDDAADWIEKNGWLVGHLFHLGQACSNGAINIANHGTFRYTCDQAGARITQARRLRGARAVRTLHETISGNHEHSWSMRIEQVRREVEQWNDTVGRTRQQVLDALRQAAKNAWVRENDLA